MFVSLFPHDFATMCLTSCEFTGKAVSQINGCKCSVWCVLDMLLTFHSPCQWESGLAEKWITPNGVLAFYSQEASYHDDSLDADFCFSLFLLYTHFIVGSLITEEELEDGQQGSCGKAGSSCPD